MGADGTLDLVITNAVVIDAIAGIVKCDIGVKGTRIVGIGKVSAQSVLSLHRVPCMLCRVLLLFIEALEASLHALREHC